MYKIIGLNYERETDTPSVYIGEGRSTEIVNAAYNHGKKLWDNGDCSKYIVVVALDGRVVDYNRPDQWNFRNFRGFQSETEHFPTWDYTSGKLPYRLKKYHEEEQKEFYERMFGVYERILKEEGVEL